jgi:pyruvate formate lyase activating enzyme
MAYFHIETLEKAYEIGKKAGLNYVYVGNMPIPGKENTYCPKCGKVIIERWGYETKNHLKGDKCPYCKCKISGIYNKLS